MLPTQFTASVYILHRGKTKLIMHPKLKKWLPPGGHVEQGEDPSETAIREAKEETGFILELYQDDPLQIDYWNASSFPRPYFCLKENIPATNKEPEHIHLDLIYVGRRQENSPILPAEPLEARWFSLEEVCALQLDIEIFRETLQVIKHLLSQEKLALFSEASRSMC